MTRRVLVLAIVVALLSTLGQLSSTIFTPLSEVMALELAVETPRIALLVSAFLFAFALSQLISGPLGDALGYRATILASIALFTAASVYAAFAPGFTELMVARVLQGLGAGPALILSRAVLTMEVPRNALTAAFAVQNIVFAIVPALAPLLGAGLGTSFGWRSAFIATGLLAVGIGLVTIPLLFQGRPRRAARRDRAAAGGFPAGRIGLWALIGAVVYAPVFVAGGLLPALLADQLGWTPGVLAAITAGGVACFVIGGAVIAILDRYATWTAAAATAGLTLTLLILMPSAALIALRSSDPAFSIANIYLAIAFAGALMTLSVSVAMHAGRHYAGLTSAVLGFSHLVFGGAYLTALSALNPSLALVSAVLGSTVYAGALILVVQFLLRASRGRSGPAIRRRTPLGLIDRIRAARTEDRGGGLDP